MVQVVPAVQAAQVVQADVVAVNDNTLKEDRFSWISIHN